VGDPLHTEQLSSYGLALARAGHLRAAAYLLERANDIRPDPNLTVLTASVLLDAGDPRGARGLLEAGAAAHGWEPRTRYLRIVAATKADQADDAIGFARELAGDPDRGDDARLLLVDLLLKTGDVGGARFVAEAALRGRPDSTDCLLAQARVARCEGTTDEQLRLLERARTLDPDNLTVRRAHGIALLQTGSPMEGQRELAWVLFRRPGDPGATNALLGSSIRSRLGGLAWLAAFFLLPGICVLIAWLPGRLRGTPAPPWLLSVYFYSVLAVVIAGRIFERLRTDRSVAVIKKEAHRRLVRGRPLFPTLGPLRWLLVASLAALLIFLDLAVLIFPSTPASMASRVETFLLGIPMWLLLGAALWLWRRRRGQIARGEPRSFDPSSCQCHRVSKVGGRRANAYVHRHLVYELSVDRGEIDRFRCDLLGIPWLWFSEQSGLRQEVLPLALRLSEDFVPPTEATEDQRAGFYL
jgi:Flp pilus assembly protein TadD